MKKKHLTSPLSIRQAYFDKLKTFCLTASEKDIMLFFEHCHLGNYHIEHNFSPEKYHQTLTCGQGSETSNVLTSCRLCRTLMRVVIEAIPERPELKRFFTRTPESCPICAERKKDHASRVYHFVKTVRSTHNSTTEPEMRNHVLTALQTHNPLYHHILKFKEQRDKTFEHIKVRIMTLDQRALHDYYVKWIEEQSLPDGLPHNVAFSATLETSIAHLSSDMFKINPHGFVIKTFNVTQA
ncbi:hypothetical protein K6U44_04205 [Vibrio parahaemolyticus]|uniref:hypothetical protein n=1 Tax=Vibrio parahaemolyticus TaxID=670 RepID=UPI001EEB75CB|nr:hypothetical protein [Vibrio parahaemolyticus]MCG6459662.1 hypothetical protein [Vibrio parahaemolyticus]